MSQYFIYVIPVAIVLLIFIGGLMYSRKAASDYAGYASLNNALPEEEQPKEREPLRPRVYVEPNVNQNSDHKFGAVQSVIRGRIRFIYFGLIVVGVALFGLYVLHMTDMDFYVERTPVNMLIVTVILGDAVLYGLQLMSFASYRIKLRRTGFEISSIFGTKAYAYMDVDFHLQESIEHKYASDGYRPVFMKTESFNWIWVCRILFRDGRKPIVLKSSRYAWLKSKMQRLISVLYGNS